MCWAIPVRITAINGDTGTVDIAGTTREAGLQFLDNPAVGDYVLVHAGFAIQRLDPREARETLALWDEMAALKADESG